MPSADYVTYETAGSAASKQGTSLCGGARFQNVRIIQQSGGESGTAVLQQSPSPSLTSAQEQIMQAEILFEAPSTAEASLV